MKKLFILLSSFICTNTLFAASVNTAEAGVTGGNTTGVGTFPHFIFLPDDNSTTQPAYMRLVSYVYSKNNGSVFVPQDSTTYIYDNNERGGSITAEDLTNDERVLFDESYTYIKGQSGGYRGIMKRMQTYDPESQVLSLKFMPWRQTGWVDSARYLYGYNDHKMTASALELWIASQWDPHVKSDIIYNGVGKVLKMEATNYKMYFTYDGNNNLTELRDEQWSLNTGWRNKTRNTYTYGPVGMETQIYEEWDGLSWVYKSKWEYTYFASKTETMTEYERTGNSWTPVNKHIYTYGNSLQRTSETIQDWDDGSNKFVNRKYTEYTYIADVVLTDVATSHWDGSNWQTGEGDEHYRYYYEPYFPTTVKNVIAQNDVRLFPVPAANTLNLNIGWDKPEAFNVAICDMRGVIVKNWAEQPVQNYNKQIDVSDLPNGNYIIKASSSTAQLTERFIVAK